MSDRQTLKESFCFSYQQKLDWVVENTLLKAGETLLLKLVITCTNMQPGRFKFSKSF